MRLVVALGGNALLRRAQAPTAAHQLANVRKAATQLARLAGEHDLLLTHGNGPQVGLLALQAAAYTAIEPYPLDVLGAESEGMLGYLLEQELANRMPAARAVATLITRVEVDADDPAFQAPSKPIGPVYSREQADAVAARHGWTMAADGPGWRRVVPSPRPLRVPGLPVIRGLLERGTLVIAAGGGGIPVVTAQGEGWRGLQGAEAVIDKDLCSALLAIELQADCLLIATDVDAVYLDWGLPAQRRLDTVSADELSGITFAPGSMAPKVEAAIAFVRATKRRAVIGSLDRIDDMLTGRAGTEIRPDDPQ
jgi:carbamate kinase